MNQNLIQDNIQKIKTELNRVFDDNLHTKQWHNYVDYTIIGLIIISTIEVFLSTYDNIVERYGAWLHFVDLFTTIFFTIEVSLRIWCADLLDEKYKGLWGRIRYCFSFYGFIDIISTFPFYVGLYMPIPYELLKALRIARLLRIFRYMKSFKVLSRAMRAKKDELLISLQFLTIITLILSFILFFVEHEAQPEVYNNGWTSVLWAFVQYIGDPGNFADTPPITFIGRVIACILGILGIAIFAVPAGLIGAAFSEVMEEDREENTLKEDAHKINEMMLIKSVRREGIYMPTKNLSFGDIKLDLGITEDDIVKSVFSNKNLRIKNLSAAVNEGPKNDMLVVNQFPINTEYGSCVNRSSSVTIVNALGFGDNGLSFFDWHVAELGGFNYVANELFSRTISDKDKRYNFYTVDEDSKQNDIFQQFVDDIVSAKDENDWIIVVAGEQVVKNITDFHFEFGGEKGETRFDFSECITHDREMLRQLYEDFNKTMEEKGLKTDAHQVQPKLHKDNITRFIQTKTKANVLLITVSYKLMVFDKSVYTAIITMADVLNRNLENKKPKGLHTENYKIRPIESEYWKDLYGLSRS